MEQLQIRADQFRKQGRLQDEDLEEIVADIKASDITKDNKEDRNSTAAGNDEHKKVLEAVEDG